jgi:hypothetical protein
MDEVSSEPRRWTGAAPLPIGASICACRSFAGSGIGVGATQLLLCVLPKKQKNAIKFDA